ncbi:MAG: MinD/ParA family protein [Firmicutes bacterium]|jgi:flagellar biosynthesis protein FlhG|nr:MinD/ParA family protein [Bacillota bacterium]
MRNQAEILRKAIKDHTKPQRIIAVTSGKGGVGKSNLVINMSIALASGGTKVLVIDADIGLGNIDLLLGMTTKYTLEHVALGEVDLKDIEVAGPGGIKIIPGGSGAQRLLRVSEEEREALIEKLKSLGHEADFIIIDTGAGLSPNVLAFLTSVREIVVVTTPEPTAVADAYAAIKTIAYENPGASVMLVVNMAKNRKNAEDTADNISIVARKFLAMETDFLGFVPRDPAVINAVISQQPFFLAYPYSDASRAVMRVAKRLNGQKIQEGNNIRGLAGLFSKMFHKVRHRYV